MPLLGTDAPQWAQALYDEVKGLREGQENIRISIVERDASLEQRIAVLERESHQATKWREEFDQERKTLIRTAFSALFLALSTMGTFIIRYLTGGE